jgi:hypothetical protein
MLLVAVVAAWAVVVLAMLPRDTEASSAPSGERTAPTLRHSMPSPPVRV